MNNAAATMNDRMEPIQISTGRFVGFGHHVTNFGIEAVVVGSRETVPGVTFLELREVIPYGPKKGQLRRDGWLANPALCK